MPALHCREMILRARLVLPLCRPPIENGAVILHGGTITGVRRWRAISGASRRNSLDLGERILLPGLINTHSHLDYTGMAGVLPPPRHFSDWLKGLVAVKSGWSAKEFEKSWLSGAAMLVSNGVTTTADIESVPELIPAMWGQTPLRVISFRELMSIRRNTPPAELVEAAVREWSGPRFRGRVGLSPHAPYTASEELFRSAGRLARQRGWPLSTHVAESEQEFQMYMGGRGPLHDWLKSQRDCSDCGLGSPVRHLDRCGYLSKNLLAVHANYLARGDAGLLGSRGVSVVHCPRSHDYFGHAEFPLGQLATAGVNLCLGTDSLVSTRRRGQPLELNLFAEMALLARTAPGLIPERILRMASVNPARALHLRSGTLCAGARADLITIPYTGDLGDVYEMVINHPGRVDGSMIGGKWAVTPAL